MKLQFYYRGTIIIFYDAYQFNIWPLKVTSLPNIFVMNANLTPEVVEMIKALHYRPAVSILMPFEPKISLKTELTYALKIAVDEVRQKLLKDFPHEICMLMIQKLSGMVKNLDYDTSKKSIAIYASLVFEKVFYLDIAVEQKIIVDDSFEIRDLVYSKKQLHHYLLVLLSGKENRMYLVDATTFIRIEADVPESISAYENDPPQRVANFSDVSAHKQTLINKFLYHMDKELGKVLNNYQLPVFVLGAKKILGHFKKVTKHSESVLDYVEGNYEEATLPQLAELLKPHVMAWQKIKQKDLLNQLETAANKNQLAVGIKAVWQEVMNKKGRLLVVESSYRYPAQHGSTPDTIDEITEPYNEFSFIRDAVDDAIEKILLNGGDVEFTNGDVLKEFNHIALIKYY